MMDSISFQVAHYMYLIVTFCQKTIFQLSAQWPAIWMVARLKVTLTDFIAFVVYIVMLISLHVNEEVERCVSKHGYFLPHCINRQGNRAHNCKIVFLHLYRCLLDSVWRMNSSQVDQFVPFVYRLCGYIVSTAPEVYVCHVFQCAPNAAPLTKALAEACQVRTTWSWWEIPFDPLASVIAGE